jgi:hypothetical protein
MYDNIEIRDNGKYGIIKLHVDRLKILERYLHELRCKIDYDRNKCNLITTADELTYHSCIVSELIEQIDHILYVSKKVKEHTGLIDFSDIE